jgi:hypothetical protein
VNAALETRVELAEAATASKNLAIKTELKRGMTGGKVDRDVKMRGGMVQKHGHGAHLGLDDASTTD